MAKIIFTCTVKNQTAHTDLALEFWIDDKKFFDSEISNGNTDISYEFDEFESDRVLKIVLKNKTFDHTKLDESGNIISDAVLSIENICFDDINIDKLFYEHASYRHSYNGSGKQTEEKFYGTVGCNGTIELKFSTPFYMWLLEHM